MFSNLGGKTFRDSSLASGLDSIADGRCFSVFDIDRDGWQDLILVNANNPHLEIMHNRQAGNLQSENNFIALRFVGGNKYFDASTQFSNRNGYGSRVTVKVDGKEIVREHRCGRGFSSQNSATMIVGLGQSDQIDSIEIRWPSGRRQTLVGAKPGQLVTLYEDEEESPNGFLAEEYVLESEAIVKQGTIENDLDESPIGPFHFVWENQPEDKDLVIVNIMSTGCPHCLQEHGAIRSLKKNLDQAIQLVAIPIEDSDDDKRVEEYIERYSPPYQILGNLDESHLAKIRKYLVRKLGEKVYPSTIVVDRGGFVLSADLHSPDISSVRKLLFQIEQ